MKPQSSRKRLKAAEAKNPFSDPTAQSNVGCGPHSPAAFRVFAICNLADPDPYLQFRSRPIYAIKYIPTHFCNQSVLPVLLDCACVVLVPMCPETPNQTVVVYAPMCSETPYVRPSPSEHPWALIPHESSTTFRLSPPGL